MHKPKQQQKLLNDLPLAHTFDPNRTLIAVISWLVRAALTAPYTRSPMTVSDKQANRQMRAATAAWQ